MVSRRSKPQNGQHDVRFMLPMAIKCTTCGEYMFQGTKANARKELCYEEFYLGIPVYRFYIHCKACYAEIIFKTNPKEMDYDIVSGATRHFEPWRTFQKEQAEELKNKLSGSLIQELEVSATSLKKNSIQLEELEQIEKRTAHHRIPKIKDLAKIYEVNERSVTNLTPSDIAKIENFEEKKKIIPQKNFFSKK